MFSQGGSVRRQWRDIIVISSPRATLDRLPHRKRPVIDVATLLNRDMHDAG